MMNFTTILPAVRDFKFAGLHFCGNAPDFSFFSEKRIDFYQNGVILRIDFAPVAQLDRASASGVEGREFESRRVHHLFSTM